MTSNNHPITPPPEFKAKWMTEGRRQDYYSTTDYAITQAAQWGYEQRGAVNEAELQKARDEELEACCEWVRSSDFIDLDGHDALRAARRPKPPSLKEQALAVLDDASNRLDAAHENIIRRAIESLPD